MAGKRETRGRIKDARGKSVTQLDPVVLQVLHQYDVVEEQALYDIVEELEPGTANKRRRLVFLVPVALVLFAAGLGVLYYFCDDGARRDLVDTLTNPALMAPNLIACFVVPWFAARRARLQRVRFVMLKHRRCPHCGYDLRHLPEDGADSATVCPECGSAWRLDDAALHDALASATQLPVGGAAGRRRTVAVLALVLCMLAGLGVMFLLY